jgi:hypothetical protein
VTNRIGDSPTKDDIMCAIGLLLWLVAILFAPTLYRCITAAFK